MKKLFLIPFFGMVTFFHAQDYYHGLGTGINLGSFRLNYSAPFVSMDSRVLLGVPLINYKATLAFEGSGSSSFALSSYPGIGGLINTRGNSTLAFQLPVVGELYLGDLEEKKFHIGAGFAVNGVYQDSEGGVVMGPQIAVGSQFLLKEKLVSVRASYTYGLNKTKNLPDGAIVEKDSRSLIGISIFYMLGID